MRNPEKFGVEQTNLRIYTMLAHEYGEILNYKVNEFFRIDHNQTPALINRDTAKFAGKQDYRSVRKTKRKMCSHFI